MNQKWTVNKATINASPQICAGQLCKNWVFSFTEYSNQSDVNIPAMLTSRQINLRNVFKMSALSTLCALVMHWKMSCPNVWLKDMTNTKCRKDVVHVKTSTARGKNNSIETRALGHRRPPPKTSDPARRSYAYATLVKVPSMRSSGKIFVKFRLVVFTWSC